MNNIKIATDLQNFVTLLNEVAASTRISGAGKKYLCVTPQGTLAANTRQRGVVEGKLSLIKIEEIASRQLQYAAQLSEKTLSEKDFKKAADDISKVLYKLNAECATKRRTYKTARIVLFVALVILSVVIVGIPFLSKFYKDNKKFKQHQLKIETTAKYLSDVKKANFSVATRIFHRDPTSEIFRQLKSTSLHSQLQALGALPIPVARPVFMDTLREPSIQVKFPLDKTISYRQPQDQNAKETEVVKYFNALYDELMRFNPQDNENVLKTIFTNVVTLHTAEAIAEELEHLRQNMGSRYFSVKALEKSDSNLPTKCMIIKINDVGMHSRIHTLFRVDVLENGVPTGEYQYIVNSLDRTIPWDVLRIPHQKLRPSHMKEVESSAKYSEILDEKGAREYMDRAILASS